MKKKIFKGYYFIGKLYVFLFKKPIIKKGERLNYYGKIADYVYFDWRYGLWMIAVRNHLDISYGLEIFYKQKNITTGLPLDVEAACSQFEEYNNKARTAR